LGSRLPTAAPILKRRLLVPLTKAVKRLLSDPPETTTRASGSGHAAERIDLNVAEATWRMSLATRVLLCAIDHDGVRESRRRNFETLLCRLAPGARIVPFKTTLPKGCCPWFFPIMVQKDAADVKQFLVTQQIGHFRVWIIRHEHVPLHRFPFEASLKQTMFALPVHQDLREDQMTVIADALNRWNHR